MKKIEQNKREKKEKRSHIYNIDSDKCSNCFLIQQQKNYIQLTNKLLLREIEKDCAFFHADIERE